MIPSKGSVGSSGDLAPLAHLALVLIGEGEAIVGGERLPGAEALARAGLQPLALSAKEGLALINGTHLMTAAGGLAVREAARLVDAAVVAAALSLEAFKGSTVPFDARLHALRPQPGQQAVAERLRALLADSPIVASHADCGRVQDPYTLRCAPQVLGAVSDAVAYVSGALERELEAVTDNPLVFPGPAATAPATCSRAATSTASRCRCRSTTSRSRCASWRRSPSAASTRCSPPATPTCRPSSRPAPGCRRA